MNRSALPSEPQSGKFTSPIIGWGVILQDCMNLQVVANYPWILIPVNLIIVTVVAFSFLGGGLRDAADPCAS